MLHFRVHNNIVILILAVSCIVFASSDSTSMACSSDRGSDSTELPEKDENFPDSFDVDEFVKSSWGAIAIDTSGPEPEVSVTIETNGDFSELEAIGIATGAQGGSRDGDYVHAWVPFRLIPKILALPSVKNLRYDLKIKYHNIPHRNSTSPGTGVVSGVLVGLPLDFTDDMQFNLISAPLERIPEKPLATDSVIIQSAQMSPSAIFRLANIAPGLYCGTVTKRIDFNDTTSRSCVLDDFVIDSILVKPGMVSIISAGNLSKRPEGGDAYYVWQELFQEVEQYNRK